MRTLDYIALLACCVVTARRSLDMTHPRTPNLHTLVHITTVLHLPPSRPLTPVASAAP